MILGFLCFYLIAQIGIGYWASLRIKTETDYLLAGRSLGPWMATFAIFATWFGAETCIGAAGRIYQYGLAGGSADPFGYGLCILLMGLLLAVPIWNMNLTTLGDLFSNKYSARVEKLASLLLIPTSILWSAAQIRGFGIVLSSVSGFNIDMMITIAALIVLIYTSIGGLLADTITDLIQGILLIAGLLGLFILSYNRFGFEPLSQIDPVRFSLINFERDGILGTIESWSVPILGSLVATELITRAMASKSAKVAKNSSIRAFIIYITIGLIPVYIGLIGPEVLPNLSKPEQIIPKLAKSLMTPLFYAIFSGALISAILSTVDSALLAAGSLFSHNIILKSLKQERSDRDKVLISRLTVMSFGIIAYIMALHAEGVYSLVEEASAFGSAGIVVCVVFGARTDFGNSLSAMSSLAGGVISYILLAYVFTFDYPFIGSLTVSLVLFVFFGSIKFTSIESGYS